MKLRFVCCLSLVTVALAAIHATAQQPGRRGSRTVPPILRTLDANGDGSLSMDEIDNATAALKKLDVSGDGELSSFAGGRLTRGKKLIRIDTQSGYDRKDPPSAIFGQISQSANQFQTLFPA